MKVEKRYLILPIGYEARGKKLCLYRGGELVAEADLPLDTVCPDYELYWDLSARLGEELCLEIEPEIDFVPRFADEAPEGTVVGKPGGVSFDEKYRPQTRFSPQKGWMNDPNGLVYDGERYHLFFQHNPFSHRWSNMHWGHAVSDDLLHWEEKEPALSPDALGTIYSGSAVMDRENRSGLGKDGKAAMLLFYTAAGGTSRRSKGARFTQCLAYSTDGGKNFKKYPGNPVVSHREAENRDPKVIYVPEISAYVMAIYLDGNRYALLRSENFLDWTFLQELTLPDDAECPDLYPLSWDGDPSARYWVFSGASDRYVIGSFSEGVFRPLFETGRLHYGRNSYAAQTFSDIPASDGRRIRLSWNTMQTPGTRFCCSLCTPCEMRLKKIGERPVLTAWPIREMRSLFLAEEKLALQNIGVGKRTLSRRAAKPQWMEFEVETTSDALFSLSLFGERVEVNAAENTLSCLGTVLPLGGMAGKMHFLLLADATGFEIFAGQGEAFSSLGFLADESLSSLTLDVRCGAVESLRASLASLSSVWHTT